jgi:drug/metabolite transporter (DMT)-like permease
VTALLALASAILVGGADFLGGVTSRRAAAVRVAGAAQIYGVFMIVPVAFVVGSDRVTSGDAGWSIASGVAVGIGLMLFYAAMARGVISLIAPVAATVGASVPVAFSLARGERPGGVALLGIGLAVIAIALVSFVPGEKINGVDGLGLAFAAGALFGLFFVCLSLTDPDAGLWPLALSRAAAAAVLIVLAVVLTRGIDPGRGTRRAVVAIAALEVCAAITLLLALQRGPVAIAAVLASLYPVTTTFLAAALLHERLRRTQLAGVVLALIAIVLISTG